MKSIEPPTQTEAISTLSKSLQPQGQEQVRERKIMLLSLFLTSSLFTIALTSLPQIGSLLTQSNSHPTAPPASVTDSEPTHVINVHINQPSSAPVNVTVNVIVTPAQSAAPDAASQLTPASIRVIH